MFFQIFIPVLSVALLLSPPPAQHSSDEHQVVAVAAAAQSLFRLKTRFLLNVNLSDLRCTHICQIGVPAFHLGDLCSVLQAVVKRVSSQGRSN